MDTYDVIIIGTGAGGGTLARRLAPSGKRILLVERGDWLPREPENWVARNVFVDNRYVSPETWYDPHGKPFQPQIHYFVGGATKLYGAALYRLRQEDFGELRHHAGERTPPNRRPARRIRSRPCRTSRGSSSSRTISRRPATTRSTRPAASA